MAGERPGTEGVERRLALAVGLMRRRFGIRAFRPGQERVIRAVLAGRDVLAVMPTGSGKSLTYQLSALVLPGLRARRLSQSKQSILDYSMTQFYRVAERHLRFR